MEQYFCKRIQKNEIRAPLMDEIERYVNKIITGNIPQQTYSTYVDFYKKGSRKEFEDIYFERRKQLAALGLYLQWNNTDKVLNYFKEVLWSISNEFSWCLAAHLLYSENGFKDGAENNLDLFASETAESLCEILTIHKDKIDLMLANHIRKEIKSRVIYPFLNKKWEWERAEHNWNAVCSGCIGIVALLVEKGETQKEIIDRVEENLKYYIKGFGSDGVTLEGIGYWGYGFGYYNYYKELKGKIYGFSDDEINDEKIKAIAQMPYNTQISLKSYVPFSDTPPSMEVPSGLLTYLTNKYKINSPYLEKISSLNFDNCFRWAHLSRNLWWTDKSILKKDLEDITRYFENAQWMIFRKGPIFFAMKGGDNNEPHNHNDVGNFVLAIGGELILTDLGAGAYTAGYFSDERYNYCQTRSYWHSVPVINGTEQQTTKEKSKIIKKDISGSNIDFKIELSSAYELKNITSFYREAFLETDNNTLILEDSISSKGSMSINEGFITTIKPDCIGAGKVVFRTKKGKLTLSYDTGIFKYILEENKVNNHYNELINVYRLKFITNNKSNKFQGRFKFYCENI